MIAKTPSMWPVKEGDKAPTKAYGGCTCDCHRMPNVFHCVPCCGPGRSRGSMVFPGLYDVQIMDPFKVGMTIQTDPLLPIKGDEDGTEKT